MKKAFLLLVLFSSFVAHSQSLKDALFSGRLKNDAGSVIRKGDDLSTKIIDSTQKAAIADSLAKIAAMKKDSAALVASVKTEKPAALTGVAGNGDPVSAVAPSTEAPAEEVVAPKDNNAVLKGFMDTIVSTLKTDVLPNKRVKEGRYLVLISYAIETDGKLAINDVFVSPENDFLKEQITRRLEFDLPKMQPELSSTGKPRKVNKKYKFTIEKK